MGGSIVKTEPFFTGMETGYQRLLKGFMKIRWFAWVIIGLCGISIWLILSNLQSEICADGRQKQYPLQCYRGRRKQF